MKFGDEETDRKSWGRATRRTKERELEQNGRKEGGRREENIRIKVQQRRERNGNLRVGQ